MTFHKRAASRYGLLLTLLLPLAGSAQPIAPLLDGMGAHRHPITTNSPQAQRYFDEGLALSFSFNFEQAWSAADITIASSRL